MDEGTRQIEQRGRFLGPTAALAYSVLLFVGCIDAQPTRPVAAARDTVRVRGQGPMLETAVDALWNLDRNLRTNLRPPQVILDKTSSTDRQDVKGTLRPDPVRPLRGRNNLLFVPANNSGFVSLSVERGDELRLYLEDQELLARNRVYQNPRFRQVLEDFFRVVNRKREELQEQAGATDEEPDEQAFQQYQEEKYQEIVLPIEQEMLERELQEVGERSVEPISLIITEIRSEQSVVVAQGLPFEVTEPQRVEIWRTTDQRLKEILADLNRYRLGRSQDALAWEPSPGLEARDGAVDRLNQWLRHYDRETPWQRDAMLDTLPTEFQEWATAEALGATAFSPYDGRLLHETVWLFQIASWVGGAYGDDLTLATRLFDWTVRNVQLETAESQRGLLQRPWETLLFGRGTAADRAWLFCLLARQQGLDVVVLGVGEDADQAAANPWVTALWSQQQLYLFDPSLGLPILGPGGSGVATLEQARQDDAILDRLDLDADRTYRLHGQDLRDQQVVALIPCSPFHLSRRAMQLEAELFGEFRLQLSATPSVLAEELEPLPARLWTLPWETHASLNARSEEQRGRAALRFQVYCYRPRLWKARSLHFRGDMIGKDSATKFYRLCRPPERELRVVAERFDSDYLATIREAKRYASFWLGMLMYETAAFDEAIPMLRRQLLEASSEHEFDAAARYLLARAYEAKGQVSDAITWLTVENESPQSVGNALRARWLDEGASIPGSEPAEHSFRSQDQGGELGQ